MRSLRTAARIVVLVTLTGAPLGCGYDNPGFKLKDSGPESDGAAQTTNVSGVTMMTTTESPTSTSTSTSTSTTGSMTTQGPGVSGSETSTSMGDDLTSETSDMTTGTPKFEWPPCMLDDAVPGPAVPAVADTFLVHDGGTGSGCFDMLNGECQDQDLGGLKFFEVYFTDFDQSSQADDYTSIFAVRFDAPATLEVEGVMVPDTSVIGVRVNLHMARPATPANWMAPTFKVFSFHGGDAWQEGKAGDMITPCSSPGASFHCRVCAMPGMCANQGSWSYGSNPGYAYPALANATAELTVTVGKEPSPEGAFVAFDFPVEAIEWLTARGMLLIPDYVPEHMIGVNTRESLHPPNIQFLYCPPKLLMP